jgi:deoxyribonuclease-4
MPARTATPISRPRAADEAPPPRPALPDGRPLGAHLPLGEGMVRAVERAHAIGADALQVFVDNPTAWKRRAEPPAELPAFRARLAELGIGPVAVHASYLVNLAGPTDELYERSIELLAHEMAVAPDYAAGFVNVHVGSHKGAGLEFGIGRVADAVARVLGAVPEGPTAPLLVLESSAGGGDGIGVTVEELERILEAAAARGAPAGRLGICLDTAHLWAAGRDVATREGVDTLVEEVRARLGLDRLAMIHLNDSKAARGSRLDRHQHLGAGEMGDGAGLARLLTHPALARIPFFLETPGMDEGYDAVNVARARDLAAGRPLALLPPEALHLRGARARTPAA